MSRTQQRSDLYEVDTEWRKWRPWRKPTDEEVVAFADDDWEEYLYAFTLYAKFRQVKDIW